MFERTLADLIRGLRASSKKDESIFIARAVDEIRNEVKSKDMELKAGAILKLVYLDMLGYDMSWASFHVVEVMSSARIHLKSIGYLGAIQSFKEDTDVLMLTTNTLKKDIASPQPTDIATALDGLAQIITPDIARDLSLDLIAMLNHSRPRIRKRAVLIMYKVFVRYPEVVPRSLPRLRERLEDSDPSVVSATVNILCELARRNPRDYLPLAPQLFELLTTSSNNWMLIKLIKLLGALTPYEPRLAKKLQKPITELISTTPAVSLLYECVHTCIIGGMLDSTTSGSSSSTSLAKLCINKLSAFLGDTDQNLKYIALLALVKIVPTHSHLVAVHQNEILSSLEDQDHTIRTRALDLVNSMVTTENLRSIVEKLLTHLSPPASDAPSSSLSPSAADSLRSIVSGTSASGSAPSSDPALEYDYRLSIARQIIAVSSEQAAEYFSQTSSYPQYDLDELGNDFASWYILTLVEVATRIQSLGAWKPGKNLHSGNRTIGSLVKEKLVDATVRWKVTRRPAVSAAVRLLGDERAIERITSSEAEESTGGADLLDVAAWICGEYSSELARPETILKTLTQLPSVSLLPTKVVSAFLTCSLKVFGTWAARLATSDLARSSSVYLEDDILDMTKQLKEWLVSLSSNNEDAEVMERSAEMRQLLAFVEADVEGHKKRKEALSIEAKDITNDDEKTSGEPSYPKSLFLVQPLIARSLHPLPLDEIPTNIAAESSLLVPIPEGLDLDAWIVAPSKLKRLYPDNDEVDVAEGAQDTATDTLVLKKKKGKGKEKAGDEDGVSSIKRVKKKKVEGHESSRLASSGNGAVEAVEERVARDRRRAELAEERRHDPFYLSDRTASKSRDTSAVRQDVDDDLDSIPVVKLDGMPSLAAYNPVRSNPPTPILVERSSAGSHARGATPASTPGSSLRNTSILASSSASNLISSLATAASKKVAPLSGGFAPYDAGDDEIIPPAEREVGISTPEPIKVVKVKKKKSSKPKVKSSGE